MHRPLLLLLAVLLPIGPVALAMEASEAEAIRHFVDRVHPVLRQRCFNCHGPEEQKGALRLDSREAVLRGGDLGPSVIPGKPAESRLIQAIHHTTPDLEMPPKEKLSSAEIVAFERWIREGAPWPAGPIEGQVRADPASATLASEPGSSERLGDAWSDPRNPIIRIFQGKRLDLWSLRPPSAVFPALPAPGPDAVSKRSDGNPVDAFILAGLRREGRTPAVAADRRTLIRRVSFDLTGLPPSPEAVQAFETDPAPDAYERLVDRLLSSPRYGEHQARLWLDVIRYSDSNGFDWDEFRPEAWRFRDYAVRAFNEDKPFDRFVLEQLAGDELVNREPSTAEDQDRLVATGYLRLGPQDNSAPLFDEGARARAEWLADLTETTASAFLAVTMSCCRCHDHKFDPLSQADHFRLRAFFEPVKYADDVALDLAAEQAEIRAQHAEVEVRIAPLAKERDEVLTAARQRVRGERLAKLENEERRLLDAPTNSLSVADQATASAVAKKLEVSEGDAVRAFTEAEKQRHSAVVKKIEALNRTRRPFTRGLMATDTTNAVPATRILYQGDPKAEREAVVPGFLSALDPNPAEVRRPEHGRTTGRRLALARWIASEGNPLTARVFVNRAWQSVFGQGLVATPNDFGLAGARPTHPELLDWLATDFIRSGWSVKSLLRRLVTSATYRQSSSRSGEGSGTDTPWLDRQRLRRLSAEQLRDALLEVSGLLQPSQGGPPIWPELPADVLQANPAFLDDNAEKTKGWYPSPPEKRSVRSLYLVQKRTVRVPFLETFDLPENSTSCARRNESIVAPQALSLLNSAEAVGAARALADRVVREAGPDAGAQVSRMFALALQRGPTADERAACIEFLGRRGPHSLARAVLNLNEFAFLD